MRYADAQRFSAYSHSKWVNEVSKLTIVYNAWQLGEVQEFERQKLNSDSGTNSLYFAKLLVIGSRVIILPEAKLKICRSEKEKCKGG